MAAGTRIVPRQKADFCGGDKLYIVRADLGQYLESSDFHKGTDLNTRSLHPDCCGGDHYLSYLHAPGSGPYFVIIYGDHYRVVKDLSTAADMSGATPLHEKCRGGDFYLGTSRSSFVILFSDQGIYRVVSDLGTAKKATNYKLHNACKGGLYYWATKNKWNDKVRYYLVKQVAGEFRFHYTRNLRTNSCGATQTFHHSVMKFLMMARKKARIENALPSGLIGPTVPKITKKPDGLENITPGKPAEFISNATGGSVETKPAQLTTKEPGSPVKTNPARLTAKETGSPENSVKMNPAELTARTITCLIASAVILAVLFTTVNAGCLGLSVWLQWQSTSATTSGQSTAVSRVVPDFNCHLIERKLDLFDDLKPIANWEMLCFQLGVSDEKIDNIKYTYHGDIVNKKMECLDAFYKLGSACWEKVVTVVSSFPFENRRLAKKIAFMHGIEYSVK